ncbi:MAG TPA: TMEM175 family protein [Pirellulaceae bacterium]
MDKSDLMQTGRLEAFSDCVISIIITVMLLEIHVPRDAATLEGLRPLVPSFLSYVLSFMYLGIYWSNHHHMFQVTERVTGGVLWANLHLLFWLSLIPFVTGWMGANHFAATPTAQYGVVLLMAAIAYYILVQAILAAPGGNPVLAEAIGRDWKGKISPVIYLAAIPLAYLSPWIANGLYVVVALMWLVPDARIESKVRGES